MARDGETDQIPFAALHPLPPNSMTDENPDPDKTRIRRQPPVPVAFAVFMASVVGFMLVVTGLFALMRYLGGR